MGEIVNLRTHRRRRHRTERAEAAAGNRARSGRTGAEKQRDRLEKAQAERALDGARLEAEPEPDPTGA